MVNLMKRDTKLGLCEEEEEFESGSEEQGEPHSIFRPERQVGCEMDNSHP